MSQADLLKNSVKKKGMQFVIKKSQLCYRTPYLCYQCIKLLFGCSSVTRRAPQRGGKVDYISQHILTHSGLHQGHSFLSCLKLGRRP